MNDPESDLLNQVLSEYSVGELTQYQLLTRGYVNTSYAITTSSGGTAHKYLLRIYRPGIQEAEVIFEHSIIKHLVNKGFDLAAGVLPTTSGATYVRRPGQDGDLFFAIFDYLPGEDKYTWIHPECSPDEVAESGIALARFHNAVCDLKPSGQRIEPRIMDMLPLIEDAIQARLGRQKGTAVDACLADNQASIICAINNILNNIDADEFGQTVFLAVHGDYHPGNLKFEAGKIVGLFDLDWSKIDARTFDLGLALTYFCATWDEDHPDDYFMLDRAGVFLKAYQTALVHLGGLRPLDAVEIKYLPDMAAAGNIYVMEWCLRDFYGRDVDVQEYLGYLRHHVHLMRWYEDRSNRLMLERIIAENVVPVEAMHSHSRESGQ